MSLSGLGGRGRPDGVRVRGENRSERWMPDGCVENRTLVREWPCVVAHRPAQQRKALRCCERPRTAVQGLASLCTALARRRIGLASLCTALARRRIGLASLCTALARRRIGLASLCEALARRRIGLASLCEALARRRIGLASLCEALARRRIGLASLCEAFARRHTALRHCAQPPRSSRAARSLRGRNVAWMQYQWPSLGQPTPPA